MPTWYVSPGAPTGCARALCAQPSAQEKAPLALYTTDSTAWRPSRLSTPLSPLPEKSIITTELSAPGGAEGSALVPTPLQPGAE